MAMISCKVDPNLKRDAENIFNDLGITMSAAINMFLKATVRSNGLPISTSLPKYNKVLDEIIEEEKDPNNLSPKFKTIKELEDWLREAPTNSI